MRFSPVWAKQRNIARLDRNGYLDSGQLARQEGVLEAFFNRQDKKVIATMRQDYQLREAAYERRRASGVTTFDDARIHNEEMSSFSKDAMKRLSKVHVKSFEKRMRVVSEEIPEAREPVAVAALAAALYRGHTFRFRAGGARFESFADAKDRNASMSLVFPRLRSSLAYSRDDNLAAKLNASLTDNVSAELNTAQKGSLSLNYGLSF